MILNRVKLGRVLTFIKHLSSVVSLIFLALTLIWSKITLPAYNSLNLAELVVNEPMNSMYKTIYQYSYFYRFIYAKGINFKSFKLKN